MAIPYKVPPRLLKASAVLVALLAGGVIATTPDEAAHQQAVADQTVQTIGDYEGYVPEGYLDPVGIPTKCYGEIDDVVVGKKYSFDECERGLNAHVAELLKPVRECIKDFDRLPDKTKISIASMSYNIGNGAMCNSTIVKYFNEGNWERACTRMSEIYKYATDRRTGKKVELKGLAIRRKGESELCLMGLKEGVWSKRKKEEKKPEPVVEMPVETKQEIAPGVTQEKVEAPVQEKPVEQPELSLLERICQFFKSLFE